MIMQPLSLEELLKRKKLQQELDAKVLKGHRHRDGVDEA